jgi:drug/metabolite transporter (DMT)-like permease
MSKTIKTFYKYWHPLVDALLWITVMPLAAPPLMFLDDNKRGVAWLLVGIALFNIQDLILKSLSGTYPLHEAMVVRSLTSLPILLVMVATDGGLRQLLNPGWSRMISRGFVMFVAYTAYYLGLAALPMATTVALYFSAPLFITVLSVVILKEMVGPRRWLAIAVGFAGVLVMLRPGSTLFEIAAILPVASGLAYALAMVQARHLGGHYSAAALAFWGNIVFLFCASVLALIFGGGQFADESSKSMGFLLRGWVVPSQHDLLLMMACGLIAALGLTFLTQAYRIAQANIVAPFEYSAMIWGVVYGWAFWGDWPDTVAWTGIFMIIWAGIYVLWRETRTKAV